MFSVFQWLPLVWKAEVRFPRVSLRGHGAATRVGRRQRLGADVTVATVIRSHGLQLYCGADELLRDRVLFLHGRELDLWGL